MDLAETIAAVCGLPPREAAAVADFSQTAEHRKNELLIREGRPDPWVRFVLRGAVRGYAVRGERSVNLFFAFEGEMMPIMPAGAGVAALSVEALEPVEVLRIDSRELERLYVDSAALARWGLLLARRCIGQYEKYFTDYHWLDKKTQYLRLLEEYPQLLQRIPLKELASYLNVTPQSLSRIRAAVK